MKKVILSLFLYSIAVYATPEGFELISGQASSPQIDSQGQIYIQSTQDSVVHWNSFSLNPQEVLIFNQAQETSSILNRVVGSDPSEILGKLQSNGMVYLINQNGILIGPHGVIETAGFLASTLDVFTQDFFTKNTLEFFGENPGSIVNLGTISCPIGQVTLLAQSIENRGEINGSVQALACTKATLQIDNQRVFIQTNQELNTENLQSLNTSVQKNPYAHAIKHSGRITANTLGTQEGRVYLFAQEGTTEITGNVEASDIQLLGKEVLLKEQAIIDASSDAQGGKVFIGGSYKGQNPNIPLAKHVLIDHAAQIHADARQTGDGGEIIIWSEENTEFLGSLSAKGGALSGDGGFTEVSGRKGLSFEGLVDLTAANGKTGNLLIDPDNINIIAGGMDSATGQTFNTTGTVNISGNNIVTAINSANLTLQANQNISIQEGFTNPSANNLTLEAGGNITTSGGNTFAITSSGGSFNATFNSSGSMSPPANDASFIATNLIITTNGGDIIIQQGDLANFIEGGIFLTNCIFNTAAGSVELTINPNNNLATSVGISLNSTRINTIGTNTGATVLNGTGAQGGISLLNSMINGGGINATGIATTGGAGIQLENSILSMDSGNIILNGQAPDNNGIGIAIDGQEITTSNGSVTLNSNIGSIALSNGTVLCTEELTVNSQTDCFLTANTATSSMRSTNGIFNFTIGRDLILTSSSTAVASNALIGPGNVSFIRGSLQFTVGRNVSLKSNSVQNFSLIGYGTPVNPSNVTGDILFNHVGGDLVLQGANNGTGTAGFAQIGHLSGGGSLNILNGDISLLVDGSISVIGGSAGASSYAQIGHGGSSPFTTTGQLTAIAGKNIVMQSNAGPANIINAGGNVTLVTDNLFPTSPLIGAGFFSINSNLLASGELRIYTAARSQNQINDLINGAPFIPGTLFVNTNEEMWSTYYPGGSYGGGPFTIYYKDGTIEAIEDTFQFVVDQAELSDILPVVNPPVYQAKLDYFFERELTCFDPYRRVLRYRIDQKNLTR